MSVRSKAYSISLPGAAYSDHDLRAPGQWSCDNCCRSVVTRVGHNAVWVAEREKRRSKGEWLRHVRGVLSALALNTQPLVGDTWLALCSEPEARELIEELQASARTHCESGENAQSTDSPCEDTRDVALPGRSHARRKAAATEFVQAA